MVTWSERLGMPLTSCVRFHNNGGIAIVLFHPVGNPDTKQVELNCEVCVLNVFKGKSSKEIAICNVG
jgi:hypothetical protein